MDGPGEPAPKLSNANRRQRHRFATTIGETDSSIHVDRWQGKKFEIRIAEDLFKARIPSRNELKSEFPCRQVAFAVWSCPCAFWPLFCFPEPGILFDSEKRFRICNRITSYRTHNIPFTPCPFLLKAVFVNLFDRFSYFSRNARFLLTFKASHHIVRMIFSGSPLRSVTVSLLVSAAAISATKFSFVDLVWRNFCVVHSWLPFGRNYQIFEHNLRTGSAPSLCYLHKRKSCRMVFPELSSRAEKGWKSRWIVLKLSSHQFDK